MTYFKSAHKSIIITLAISSPLHKINAFLKYLTNDFIFFSLSRK